MYSAMRSYIAQRRSCLSLPPPRRPTILYHLARQWGRTDYSSCTYCIQLTVASTTILKSVYVCVWVCLFVRSCPRCHWRTGALQ